VGGRGGGLESVLGAMNLYMISYVLATFSFGKVSGFVTQLSYGVILIVSLLINVVLTSLKSGAGQEEK
jgi:ribose transport system permease protein